MMFCLRNLKPHMWCKFLADCFFLLREGALSGLWGLQCPIHCGSSSLSVILLSFLLQPTPPADHYLAALIAQSRALNTLVAHLHTSQTDPMAELTAGGQGMGIKGAAGREKLQGLGMPDSPILPEGLPKHPPTNGPLRPCSHDHGGGKRDFPGEVRRFWPEHRTRPDDVGFGAYLQPRVEGKPGRCARSRCTISSDVGAGFTGWRTVASGMVARITGRSTPKSMAQQDPSRHGGRRPFGALCAQSELGNHSTGF